MNEHNHYHGLEYNPDQHTTYQFDATYFGTPERTFVTKPPRKITAYRDAPVDVEEFLGWFYEFDNEEVYPHKLIEVAMKRARMYVTEACQAQCDYLDGDDRSYARALLAAHIIIMTKKLQEQITPPQGGPCGAGGALGMSSSNGVLTSASVGGVSISLKLPESRNAWQFWLNQTQYGIQFQAFMESHVPVGIYAMGDDLRSCFRD